MKSPEQLFGEWWNSHSFSEHTSRLSLKTSRDIAFPSFLAGYAAGKEATIERVRVSLENMRKDPKEGTWFGDDEADRQNYNAGIEAALVLLENDLKENVQEPT